MRAALADLTRHLGVLPAFAYRLASSSAAGGLRMVTVGLVRELTAEAARQAALGAGARLVGTFAYRLTASDVSRIEQLSPDVLLLAGGTDGGNSEVVLHNARRARPQAASPVRSCWRATGTRWIHAASGSPAGQLIVTENVMPEFNVLNIEPARGAIREVFIDRIVHAKGIDRAQAMFDAVLMPTPAAVMEGAQLLADGCAGAEGLGALLVVDPGGATTDVHSVAAGEPSRAGVIPQGLPEPRVKRTVEGDLGMRHNAAAIDEAAGTGVIAADSGLPATRVQQLVAQLGREVERVPGSADERALDRALARAAVRLAVKRHAGTVETVFTVSGPAIVQHGKDLSDVGVVIGTGGALVHSPDPAAILGTALADPREPFSLRPRAPRLLLDREYILYACGLLGQVEPRQALALGLAHLAPLGNEEAVDGRNVGT